MKTCTQGINTAAMPNCDNLDFDLWRGNISSIKNMGAVSITIISTSVSTNTWVQGHVTEDDTIFVETAS